MVKMSSRLLVATALLTTAISVSTAPGSGFVSSDSGVTFALNIPQGDDSNDLYFTLAGPASASWIAVGMDSSRMASSLMFLLYADHTGSNVTLSPRLAHGHVEPIYTSTISVTVLPGSGIADDVMTVNAMCTGCRSWKGGSIDPTNTAAEFIFAMGPENTLKSDSGAADLKRHEEYGSFVMDLTKAVGVAGVPAALTADSAGTTQQSLKIDHDFSAPLHAVLMILAFVVLMPFGVFILRIFKSPKWHGINQVLSATTALIGAALGIYIATLYNRSKNFNSAHQVFGLIIIAASLGQTVLGFLHHRIYKRTQSPTKLAPVHIWLGRGVILCGVINGFLGFPLALNPKYNWALVTIVLLGVIVVGPFAFWRWRRDNDKKSKAMNAEGDGGVGYQAQPWTSLGAGASQSQIQLGEMRNGYPPTHEVPTYGQPPVQGRQFV